jgi:hypothetical protein
MTRLKIGDLVEVRTSLGLTYAQYTHKHARYGALLRVFKKVYAEKHRSLEDILNDEVRFSTFFPLKATVEQGIVEVVGSLPVPKVLSQFPVFRAGVIDPSTGKVATWWLWDGENEVKIGNLSEEQKHFPIRGVWNDTLLIERIESNWTPSTDSTT